MRIFMFAAMTLIQLVGSAIGRMNIKAWMAFIPLWLLFSFTIRAFSRWGRGFLYHWGVIDYSGGYVIHVTYGVVGFTAAYGVGPRLKSDREMFSPNNRLLMLNGARLLWLGGSGFNDRERFCITSGAGMICSYFKLIWHQEVNRRIHFNHLAPSLMFLIHRYVNNCSCMADGRTMQAWAAMVMGTVAGSVPSFTMMILHKKSALLQKLDDNLAVFHTHAIVGVLGGLTGLLVEPHYAASSSPIPVPRAPPTAATSSSVRICGPFIIE
ncbi:unnamed protein product [Musa acuminata var. zebrina]